jgi:hypothetical protein
MKYTMKRISIKLVFVIISINIYAQSDYKVILNNLNTNVQDSFIINIKGGNLKVYNLYKSQYRCLYNYYMDKDTAKLYNDYYNNSYLPFKPFWLMYSNDSLRFVKRFVVNNKKYDFENLSTKVSKISMSNMDSLFTAIAKKMTRLTGFSIIGSWYVCLNEKFCDLCGNGKMMLVDINHSSVNFDHIRFILPHEFNHQIFFAQKSSDSIIKKGFGAFINEGLASYVNYIFWDKKYSPAKNLLYSEEEYKWCISNENMILNDAKKLYLSSDWEKVEKYLIAGKKVYKDGPSRLGYFVGFRLC